jgi:hypothetical protein
MPKGITGVAIVCPAQIKPTLSIRIRSICDAVLNVIKSVVPAPVVLSNDNVEPAAVPPAMSGVVTDVPIVGDALNDGAPALAVRTEFAGPGAVTCKGLVPLP